MEGEHGILSAEGMVLYHQGRRTDMELTTDTTSERTANRRSWWCTGVFPYRDSHMPKARREEAGRDLHPAPGQENRSQSWESGCSSGVVQSLRPAVRYRESPRSRGPLREVCQMGQQVLVPLFEFLAYIDIQPFFQ